jgi:hypothetical protein
MSSVGTAVKLHELVSATTPVVSNFLREVVAWWRYSSYYNICAFGDAQDAAKATLLDLGSAWINASDSHVLEEKRILMALMDRLVNNVDLFPHHLNFPVRHFACDHVGDFH